MKSLRTGVLMALLVLPVSARAIDVRFEEDRSLPLVEINVALKTGFATDPDGQSGLSYFMAEMLRRGTKSKSKVQIDRALDQMGAKLEVETRADFMVIRGAVLSSQLDPFLDLLSEILEEPSFPQGEFKKLKSITISELLDEQGDDSALESKRFMEFLFHGHPYGKPEKGSLKDISALTRDEVLRHYLQCIHDKNILIVGSGDSAQAKIGAWAHALAEKLPSDGKKIIQDVPTPKDSTHRRLLIVDKPERTQTQISIGQIGVLMTDPRFFALYLGNHILGGPVFTSRLMTEIRVKRGWSYGAGSGFRYGRKPRYWRAHLFPASKDAAPALAETLRQLQLAHDSGVTAEEFSFAQSSLVAKAGFMYDTPSKRIENQLIEKTLGLPEGTMKSYGRELGKLTRSQVNDALKSFLKPEELAISVVATAKDLKPALAKAAGVNEKDVTVVPYTQENLWSGTHRE